MVSDCTECAKSGKHVDAIRHEGRLCAALLAQLRLRCYACLIILERTKKVVQHIHGNKAKISSKALYSTFSIF
jgi:hypothetical protein